MDVAAAGHRSAIERALALAETGLAPVRRGDGWVAVRTGADSNDLNVVVGEEGFVPATDLVAALGSWFGDSPATWLVGWASAELTRVLREHGWVPERTGSWCGLGRLPVVAATPGLEVSRVLGAPQLGQWLDVASACGWFAGDDRPVYERLVGRGISDDRQAAWVGCSQDRPIAMARGWCAGRTLEVVDVAVLESDRRRGAARGLVGALVAWGAARGATEVVAAPSPDGWRLFASLGLASVPVDPDVCFYWS